MKCTIQALLLTVSLLIGFQPLSAGSIPTLVFNSPASMIATIERQEAIMVPASPHHQGYSNSEIEYDCIHYSSAVVPSYNLSTTTLESNQSSSRGHTLQSTLSRLYDHDYDDSAFCALTEFTLAPGNGMSRGAYLRQKYGHLSAAQRRAMIDSRKATNLVNEAAEASGMNLSKYVDDVVYGGEGSSSFYVKNGRRIVEIGSDTLTKRRAGQLIDAAHELAHSQQYHKAVLTNGGGNFFSAPFGSRIYAMDEVVAEGLALKRISRYTNIYDEAAESLNYMDRLEISL